MARIELKNTTIRLIDGYSKTGAVNQSAPAPAAGDTDIDVDTITGQIPAGCRFTFAGTNRIYTVVSTTETTGDTTNIVFTPALATEDTVPADNTVITFTGRALEIKVGDGNLTWTEKKDFSYDLDRGLLDTVREGDEQPMDVKLEFTYEFIKAITGGTPTPVDVLRQSGEASDWVSSSSDACEPYAVDIEVEYVPKCSGTDRELVTLPDFRFESLDYSIKDAQISVSGKCNATKATVVRREY